MWFCFRRGKKRGEENRLNVVVFFHEASRRSANVQDKSIRGAFATPHSFSAVGRSSKNIQDLIGSKQHTQAWFILCGKHDAWMMVKQVATNFLFMVKQSWYNPIKWPYCFSQSTQNASSSFVNDVCKMQMAVFAEVFKKFLFCWFIANYLEVCQGCKWIWFRLGGLNAHVVLNQIRILWKT